MLTHPSTESDTEGHTMTAVRVTMKRAGTLSVACLASFTCWPHSILHQLEVHCATVPVLKMEKWKFGKMEASIL